MYTIVGIESIVSKKNGAHYVRLHCTKEFNKKALNVEGLSVDTLFLETEQVFSLGDVISPVYEKSYNDKAVLVGVTVCD